MKISLKQYAVFLLLAGSIIACTKNTVDNVDYTKFGIDTAQSQLKIIYASAYAANPSVLIKINNKVVSNLIASRTPFPGGGYNTIGMNYALYLAIPKGSDTVAVVIPKAGTSVDSVVLYTTIITLPDNGPYTLNIADTLASTGNRTASLLLKNNISYVDTSSARYRFVNLMPNVPALDLYVNGVKVDSNIAYMQAGKAFVIFTGARTPGVTDPNSIPTPSWTIRPAGALPSTTALAFYTNVNTIQNQKVFTIFAMGYQGGAGTRLPYVSFTLDKNN